MKILNTSTTIGLSLVFLFATSCSSSNLEIIKSAAPSIWEKHGFQVVAYEGYTWGIGGFGPYGGACVYHRLKKEPDNGLTYSGYIQRWGDEFHVYGPVTAELILR